MSSDLDTAISDPRFMTQALALAAKGQFSTQPNPHVGCVIVKDGLCVAEGYHRRAGESHAEVIALQAAGPLAKGATVYVTLEPCNHTNRTGPCTQALIASEVGRVVFAAKDPNPDVAGNGANVLRDAGIEVVSGVLEAEALQLNRGFYHRAEKNRPFITIKVAMSLDGKMGLSSGESQWITESLARSDVQRLRARSCAVITGKGTVVADDPQLNVRDSTLITEGRQPRRVVLDSNLQLDPSYRIFQQDGECSVFTTRMDSEKSRLFSDVDVEVVEVTARNSRIDLSALMRELNARECNEVLLEAGPTMVASFIEQQLCDELIVYLGAKIIGLGGEDGLPLSRITKLSDALNVTFTDVVQLGQDLRITAVPSRLIAS